MQKVDDSSGDVNGWTIYNKLGLNEIVSVIEERAITEQLPISTSQIISLCLDKTQGDLKEALRFTTYILKYTSRITHDSSQVCILNVYSA